MSGRLPQLQLLIFDWDGTLADSTGAIVRHMQDMIVALDLPSRTDQQIVELIGIDFRQGLRQLYPQADIDQLLARIMEYRRGKPAAGEPDVALFAGAISALRRLRSAGYQLAIATGKTRRSLDQALRMSPEVEQLMCGSRTADETAAKPDPLMLAELLASSRLRPEQALMVGDTDYDAQMARQLGMRMVGVSRGAHDGARIRQGGAMALIETVAELPAWLGH